MSIQLSQFSCFLTYIMVVLWQEEGDNMKKLSSKYLKVILAICLLTGICAVAVNYDKVYAFVSGSNTKALSLADIKTSVIEAEKEVKEAKAQAQVAEEKLTEAKNEKKEAEKEVKTASKNVQKAEDAKKEAEKELAQATTKEAKKKAQKKIEQAKKQLTQAKEEKKEAEQKVETTTKQVEQAKEQVKQAEAKVENTTKKAEQVKEQEKKAEEKKETSQSGRSFTDEQLQYMLEQAKKGEQRQKEEYEAQVKAIQEQAAAKKAEREAKEQAEKEALEREEQARRERESTESLKNRGVATQSTVFGDREFTFAQEHIDTPFDVDTRDNPQEVICTGEHCGGEENRGYIWFARFKSNYNIFREPGSNNYVNNVLIGRRGCVSSWIQYAPSVINGQKFHVTWSVETTREENMLVNVYTATYTAI